MQAFQYSGTLDRAIMSLLSVFLFIPAEEIHFRGFVQGRLMKRFSLRGAIVIAAVFFGLEQSGIWPYFMWYLVIGGIIVGILHGYLYHKKGTLYPCIVSHLTFFSIAILLGGQRLEETELLPFSSSLPVREQDHEWKFRNTRLSFFMENIAIIILRVKVEFSKGLYERQSKKCVMR